MYRGGVTLPLERARNVVKAALLFATMHSHAVKLKKKKTYSRNKYVLYTEYGKVMKRVQNTRYCY